MRLVLTVTTPHTELSSRWSLLSIFWSYRGGLFLGFAGKKGTRLVILLHTERIRMLQPLTDHLAAAVKVVDAEMPVARNKRSGVPFAAGLGPHSEAETFNLIVREAERAHPDAYLSVATSVPYPNAPRQRCDLKLTTRTAMLYVEGKLLRLKGDNGKPNDNMLMHILSPYPHHRSALTDCIKLSKSGFDGQKAVVILGYDYPDIPLEPAILAFEKLASGMIGQRSESPFEALCHSVHCCGKVMAWLVP